MPTTETMEPTLVRFNELKPLLKNPADTRLPKYKRTRYSVFGRPKERDADAPGASFASEVNFGYMTCAPGKGNCSHHHPEWEIFIPLSGRWRVVLEGGELDGKIELTLGAWDMIILPPNTFHEATNIGDSDAWLISINPGKDGRPYTIHPDVIAELRALSEDAGKAAAIGADI